MFGEVVSAFLFKMESSLNYNLICLLLLIVLLSAFLLKLLFLVAINQQLDLSTAPEPSTRFFLPLNNSPNSVSFFLIYAMNFLPPLPTISLLVISTLMYHVLQYSKNANVTEYTYWSTILLSYAANHI